MKEPAPRHAYREAHARALPVLGAARTASPCSVSWEAMVGNGRVRRCATCSRQVFNVAGMNQADAEILLRERAEGACTAFYRRADKTVLTSDCPRGLWRRRARELGAVGAVALTLGLVFGWRTQGCFSGARQTPEVALRTGTPGGEADPATSTPPPESIISHVGSALGMRMPPARADGAGAAKVIDTTPPKVDVDMIAFLRAGCARVDQDTAAVLDYVDCTRALPAHVCDVAGRALVRRDALLGGLDPRVPIARCSESLWPLARGEPPRAPSDLPHTKGGILGPTVDLFVVADKGKLHVIRTRDEFVRRFAPVATDAEALAFAEALSGAYPEFAPMGTDRSNKVPLASVIEGTKVTGTPAGFRVNLFDGDVFGCGAKTKYEDDVSVSFDGAVTSARGPALYTWNSGCVD